jgi:hypothetical protein
MIMRIMLISGIVLICLIGLVSLIVSFKTGEIETPQYTIIKSIGEVEIRQYPKMIVAQTTLTDTTLDKNMNNGFRTIAGYIFGSNNSNKKIAMTAPVVVKMGDTTTMYFVMPRQYKKDELPTPNSPNVKILEEGEKILAVITYSGFSDEEKVETHREKLKNVLIQHKINTVGEYLYMGYNAPWDVINRRNEVAIEVVLN